MVRCKVPVPRGPTHLDYRNACSRYGGDCLEIFPHLSFISLSVSLSLSGRRLTEISNQQSLKYRIH